MPRIKIYLNKIQENAKRVKKLCYSKNISLNFVTKGVCADIIITKTVLSSGIPYLADSRIENVKNIRNAGIKSSIMLLRPPSYERLDECINLVDEILISELKTLEKIVECCKINNRKVNLIYMIDLGDLREGVWFENAVEEIAYALSIDNHQIVGLGTNLGCYGGVIYSEDNMNLLINIKQEVEKRTKRKLNKISGGSTAALKLLFENKMPSGINNLRVGEAILLGVDTTNNITIHQLIQDTFVLEAEIIELKVKPSIPVGKIGKDAFGRDPEFKDIGLRKKAILNVGEQDIHLSSLSPLDSKIKILHASSDHLICDITDCDKELKLGDTIEFKMKYGSVMRGMTSKYVQKVYL